jgi:hypothetical protein
MCSQRVRAPLGKKLHITCPKCSYCFEADLG